MSKTMRSPRPSEETFSEIWTMMINLAIALWQPSLEDVTEDTKIIKSKLDKMIEQMKTE